MAVRPQGNHVATHGVETTMPDDQDAEMEAGSREIASLLYHACLREGQNEDEALDEAAAALRKMRAEWEAAKRADAAAGRR